jgi:Ca2+/Na+ antiporter
MKMKSTKYKFTAYLLTNVFFGVAMYFGFFKGIDGAKNVALSFIWFSVFCAGIMLFIKDEDKKKIAKDGRSVPHWINLIVEVTTVTTLVYFSYWATALFYVLYILIAMGTREQGQKLLDEELAQAKEKETTESKQIYTF